MVATTMTMTTTTSSSSSSSVSGMVEWGYTDEAEFAREACGRPWPLAVFIPPTHTFPTTAHIQHFYSTHMAIWRFCHIPSSSFYLYDNLHQMCWQERETGAAQRQLSSWPGRSLPCGAQPATAVPKHVAVRPSLLKHKVRDSVDRPRLRSRQLRPGNASWSQSLWIMAKPLIACQLLGHVLLLAAAKARYTHSHPLNATFWIAVASTVLPASFSIQS